MPTHKPRHWLVDMLIALFCSGGIATWLAYFHGSTPSPRSTPPPSESYPPSPISTPSSPYTAVTTPTPAHQIPGAILSAATTREAAEVSKQAQIAVRNKALSDALVDLSSHGKSMEKMRADLDTKVPRILNTIAWHWATCSKSGHGNAKMAIEIAKEAVAAVPDDPWYQDTLAAGYARAGEFVDAVETEERAIALARSKKQEEWPNLDWRLDQMRQRLGFYRERHWCSEDADNPPRPPQ
jgi:hypothetical protein